MPTKFLTTLSVKKNNSGSHTSEFRKLQSSKKAGIAKQRSRDDAQCIEPNTPLRNIVFVMQCHVEDFVEMWQGKELAMAGCSRHGHGLG